MRTKRILNFAAKSVLLLLSLIAIPNAYAQLNTNTGEVILIGAQPPAPSQVNVSVIGTPGATVRCYFVVANYASGSVVNTQFPACVTNANNTLSSSNYVNIGWTDVTSPGGSPVTYDVIVQTQTGPFPVSGSCTSCAVATALSASTSVTVDNGGALTNYTFAGFATPNPTARIHINNDAFSTPQITIDNWPVRITNGNLYLMGGSASGVGGTLHKISLITDGNDNSALGFTATASAIDYFNLTNAATGGTPVLGIGTTTDANVPIRISPKGTGALSILPTSNTNPTATFSSVASAVNGFAFTPSATGVIPTIGIGASSDTNVALGLTCAGTCAVISGVAADPILSSYQIGTQTNSATLSAAVAVNAIINGTPTGAANYQVPSAANMCIQMGRGLSAAGGGIAADFVVRNTSGGANTITMTTNTGITLTGTMTIAQNNFRQFRAVATSCAVGTEAVTIYGLASGAF